MIVMTNDQYQTLLKTDLTVIRNKIKQYAPMDLDSIAAIVGQPKSIVLLAVTDDPDLVLVPESLEDLVLMVRNPKITYQHSKIDTGS